MIPNPFAKVQTMLDEYRDRNKEKVDMRKQSAQFAMDAKKSTRWGRVVGMSMLVLLLCLIVLLIIVNMINGSMSL